MRSFFQIVTESQKGIRKRLPAAKNYIAYPETTQGERDLRDNMRQKTRAVRSSYWQIKRRGNHPLNSTQLNEEIIQKENIKNKNLKAAKNKVQNTGEI